MVKGVTATGSLTILGSSHRYEYLSLSQEDADLSVREVVELE
jgi:hypothetical protein